MSGFSFTREQLAAGRHLGDRLSDYVDRVLPEDELRAGDRHLVACLACRAAVEEERRLLASLRRSPVPAAQDTALQQMLLGLASQGPSAGADAEPPRPGRLEVLSSAAPAMHRSARRSVTCAGLTVAACAVAAWAVASSQPVITRSATTPAVQPAGTVGQSVSWSGPWSPASATAVVAPVRLDGGDLRGPVLP